MAFDLSALKDGSSKPAYDDLSEDTGDKFPPDFDLDKFNKGRAFFIRNVGQCISAMMCSLVCGMCVRNLLDVLVATGATCRPWDSVMRYMKTTEHILKWHYGNVWDETSSARKSIRAVRQMHNKARSLMESKQKSPEENSRAETTEDKIREEHTAEGQDNNFAVVHVTQYDMSLVQCGFFGLIIMYPRKFGIRCTQQDLDNYVYFWRCIGFLLGIKDHNNICIGGYNRAYKICKAIEQDILLPSFYDPPKEFYPMAKAYTDGVNMILHFRITSPEHMFALGLDCCGEPVPFKMTLGHKFSYYLSKTLVVCHLYLPGFTWLMRKIHESLFGCHKMT